MRDRIHLLSISLAMMLAAYVLVQVEADVASEEGRLISLINQERNSRGLDVLLSHPLLTQAARDYSREMMTHGFFSHVSEVDGSTVFDRIKRTGYYDDNHGPIVVRENIAFISGSANAASAHQGFMNSEGHRLNTIASDVNEVGVGITEGSFRSVYGSIYVEVFAYHVRDQETTTSVSTMISVSVTPNDITLQLGQGAIFAIHVDAGRSTSASIQVINLPSSIMWSIDKPSGVTPLDAKLTVIAAPTAVGMHTFSIVVAVAGQTRILSCRLNVLQPTEASTSTATLISSSSRTSSTTSSPQTSTITSVSRTQSSPSTSITLSTQTKTHSFTVETNRTPTISLQTSSSTRQTQASTTTTGRSTTDYIITRTTTSVISLPRLRCIIATAAFGSELSEQVQFLREFRDKKVMLTQGGISFMSVFNRAYYSISPTVAEFVAQHRSVAFIMRALIYPLLIILHLTELGFDYLRLNPEIAVVAVGLLASSFIGVIYLLPVFVLIHKASARMTKRTSETDLLRQKSCL